MTSLPRRCERRTTREPATPTIRSVIGICFSSGAAERPRNGISCSRRTGRERMLPIRPCGRWTTSAKIASGRKRLLGAEVLLDPAVKRGVGVAEAPQQAGAGGADGAARAAPRSRRRRAPPRESAAMVAMTWKASARGGSGRRAPRRAAGAPGDRSPAAVRSISRPPAARASLSRVSRKLSRVPQVTCGSAAGAANAIPRSSGEASAPASYELS